MTSHVHTIYPSHKHLFIECRWVWSLDWDRYVFNGVVMVHFLVTCRCDVTQLSLVTTRAGGGVPMQCVTRWQSDSGGQWEAYLDC